jgi:hypothetical protein
LLNLTVEPIAGRCCKTSLLSFLSELPERVFHRVFHRAVENSGKLKVKL